MFDLEDIASRICHSAYWGQAFRRYPSTTCSDAASGKGHGMDCVGTINNQYSTY